MNLYSWLLFFHVLGAIGWLGGGLMLTVVGLGARSRSTPDAISEFARTLPYAGPRVLLPSSVLVPATGIWMVLAHAGWNLSQLWVLIAIGLFALAFLVGALQVGRIGINLAKVGVGGSVGDLSPSSLLDQWLIWYGVVLVVLTAAAADMVFKPGL
jgi:uncharacterized membrane protein